MKGILWYVTRKLEGIFDRILMEFCMRISEDKNQIKKLMYIPRFLSSGLYGSYSVGWPQTVHVLKYCPSFTTKVVLFFVALVAKPRVATQYHFNEKPHTIADDMVSHHVITLFFVLLATRSIQKTVPSVGWYILPPKWQKPW